MTCEPRRSCGPMLEWRRVGRPACEPPGVPPGDEAHDGAILIFGAIKVLSDRRRPGSRLTTRRKLLVAVAAGAAPALLGPAPWFMLFELVELFDPKNH